MATYCLKFLTRSFLMTWVAEIMLTRLGSHYWLTTTAGDSSALATSRPIILRLSLSHREPGQTCARRYDGGGAGLGPVLPHLHQHPHPPLTHAWQVLLTQVWDVWICTIYKGGTQGQVHCPPHSTCVPLPTWDFSRVHDVLPGRSEGYNLLLLKDNDLLTLKQIEEKCCHFPIVPIYM